MSDTVDTIAGKPITVTRAGVTATRVGASLGAEISGVDLTQPLSDGEFSAIEDALVENELIIFRDQEISSDDLMRFGRRFGELTVHPFAPSDGETLELIKFRNDADHAPFGTDVWHSDETFRAEPPMATILCAKEVPRVGGDTMYASMTAAFEGLSDRMQHFISGLEAIHDIKPFRPLFGDSENDRKQLQHFETMYPLRVHPVVRVHPVSGRKVLFVNPQFTIAIKDMDERESRVLLDTLFQQALIPEIQFRHRWAAAHHRHVGQPVDPALRHPRLLPAAAVHGTRHDRRRPRHRRRSRRPRHRPQVQVPRAGGCRSPRRPSAPAGTRDGDRRIRRLTAGRDGYSAA